MNHCESDTEHEIKDLRARVAELELQLQRFGDRASRDVVPAERVSERYALLLETERFSNVGSWVWDINTNEVMWSTELFRILGYDPATEKATFERFFSRVHPEDVERVREISARALEHNISERVQFRVVRTNGEIRHVSMDGALLFDSTGALVRAVGTIEDLTARMAAEEALRLGEIKFKTVFDRVRAGVAIVHTETGRFLEVNRAFCEITGYNEEELKNRDFQSITHPDDLTTNVAQVAGVYSGELTGFEVEKRYFRKDGSLIWVTLSVGSLVQQGPRTVQHVAVIHDISERKRAEEQRGRLEEQLRHSQKMEAIGTLAGGVAHDFNNILTGLLSGVELLQIDIGHQYGAELDDLKSLVMRGGELTRQLLGFGRKGKYELRALKLSDMVNNMCSIFGQTRRDISIKMEMSGDSFTVWMDQTQLEQVLINLLINSGDAMPHGGEVFIAAGHVMVSGVEASAIEVAEGKYVKVTIRDTGIGMAPELMKRIFEPFFTTKAPGSGTGLGLSSVYGIVKSHGGGIHVESEVGKGTCFSIYLPSSEVAQIEKKKPVTEKKQVTVLLVDDETILLQTTTLLLRSKGYAVFEASNGEQALEILASRASEISVVLLDLIMPGLGGAKTFERITTLAPAVKVLLCSGYSQDGQAQELLSRGCHGFIQKPYTIANLSAKIQSIL